jgi:N-acetylglucosamine-6-phosphate deacetylase
MVKGRSHPRCPQRLLHTQGQDDLTLQGFIDLHTHGIGRYDTRTDDPSRIIKMAELHAAAGTSAILPAIYPGKMHEMRSDMEAVRRAMEMQTERMSRSTFGGMLPVRGADSRGASRRPVPQPS